MTKTIRTIETSAGPARLIPTSPQDVLPMFGCSEADLDAMIASPLSSGKLMLAASMLSDAQHVLQYGQVDSCRQYINRAKYVLVAAMKEARS